MSTLQIKDFHVQVATNDGPRPILKGVDLITDSSQVHAIIGPNGSGKSILAYSVAGYPDYEVTDGEILLDGVDLLEVSMDEHARANLFLAMQYPVEVPGVTATNSLCTAKTAIDGQAPKACQWANEVNQAMKNLRMDSIFSQRDVSADFSGGEKRRFEILQMELLRPRFAVLDETNSGSGVDALCIISEGVSRLHDEIDVGLLPIAHYTRIPCYTKPDHVHVFIDGRVAEAGGPDLADRLEEESYDHYLAQQPSPCWDRRRRAAQWGIVVGPSIEAGGLRFLIALDPVVGDHARNHPTPNRKGIL